MVRCVALAAVLCLLSPVVAAPDALHDDCDAGFIAFVGSEAYRFSPHHAGELGTVKLFSVLSYQGLAAHRHAGQALWRLEIRSDGPDSGVVRTAEGEARLEPGSAVARVEFEWDGRDQGGRLLPAGRYLYTFRARYLDDRIDVSRAAGIDYSSAARVAGSAEAYASTDEVVLDPTLDDASATGLRASRAATTCQVQQNTPIESGFAYNFYYGSTHGHSNYSDGGHPLTGCSSGNAYGSGTFDPAAVYNYARQTAGLDYWVINEHNHLIQDAVATNNPPVTEAKVRQRYQDGRAAANAATVNGSFVGVYGMEWGVSTQQRPGPRDAAGDAAALRLGDLHDLQRSQPRVHARLQLLLRRVHAEAVRLPDALPAVAAEPVARGRARDPVPPGHGRVRRLRVQRRRGRRAAGHRGAQRARVHDGRRTARTPTWPRPTTRFAGGRR